VFARKRRRRGFGGLIRFGMAYASGPYCAILSSDGTDPVEFAAHVPEQTAVSSAAGAMLAV